MILLTCFICFYCKSHTDCKILPPGRLTWCKRQGMNISHVSGISPPVPLPCVLADASDPHHVVTDYLDAMLHRHRSRAKYEELSDTLSACCPNCPRALWEYWTVACLSKSPHHSACSAYARHLVPTDTNRKKKSSGMFVFPFFRLFVVILPPSQLCTVAF